MLKCIYIQNTHKENRMSDILDIPSFRNKKDEFVKDKYELFRLLSERYLNSSAYHRGYVAGIDKFASKYIEIDRSQQKRVDHTLKKLLDLGFDSDLGRGFSDGLQCIQPKKLSIPYLKNQNALKREEISDTVIQFRIEKRKKNEYMHYARMENLSLSEWIIKKLDKK